jgi:chromosome segregation ATPase
MKPLQWINLFGVLGLAALCVFQWQRDRRLNLEVNRLEAMRQRHEQKIADQEKAARALNDDLSHFKEKFQAGHSELAEASTNVSKLKRENSQLGNERDQLKMSLTNWTKAVTERDERLREANARLQELSTRLNDSVGKFNELATNYNASVQRFNDLATNYNSVVTQLNVLRGAGKR